MVIKAVSIRGLEDEYIGTNLPIQKDLFSSETGGISIDTLYSVMKSSPEITAAFMAIVEDIMSDGWKFSSMKNGQRVSKENLKNANDFQRNSRFFKRFTDALMDYLITGDGYILKLSVDEKKLSTLVTSMTRSVAKRMGVKYNKNKIIELVKQTIKADQPKDLQVLKSSTIKKNFDETGLILSYEQKVSGKTRVYQSEDVIDLQTLSIGGQPYGFTPLEPLLSDMATLIFAKEFAGKYFENDGTPTFIINLPKESPNGRNYKNLKKEMKELRKKAQKYRSLITTGEINVDQINKFNKDLEYSKLIQHWTQIVFMCLGVPPIRVHYTLDKSDSSTGTAGKEEAGYWKKISFLQKSFEEIFNLELWNDFGIEMKFNRGYKIDEMREAEITRILSEIGAITIEEARERIGMDPELPDGTMARSIGSDMRARDQSNEAAEQEPQTSEDTRDNKLKTLKFTKLQYKSFNSDAIHVNFGIFKSIVEKKVGIGNFVKGNVLYIETDIHFILFFNDGSWKYKSKVMKKSETENEKFKAETLFNFIKLEFNYT